MNKKQLAQYVEKKVNERVAERLSKKVWGKWWTYTLFSLAFVVIGYFAGVEHIKYRLSMAIESSLKPLEKLGVDPEPAPKQTKEESKIKIELLDWSYTVVKKGSFDYYRFSFQLKNNMPSNVKLIEGNLVLTDLLGGLIALTEIPRSKNLASGDVADYVSESMIYESMEDNVRLQKLKKDEIIARLEIEKIAFDDNTVISK